jgi:hypothetical protein
LERSRAGLWLLAVVLTVIILAAGLALGLVVAVLI